MIFVDTNYFLRFLLQDVKEQYKKAKNLFLQGADGQVELFTSLIVIFEIYWVLTSFYQKKKEKVVQILGKVLGLEFIEVENKDALLETLRIYRRANLEFEDCYNLALMRKIGIEEIKTFDRRLSRYFGKG